MEKKWVILEVAQARFDICKTCDRFLQEDAKCSETGSFLKDKVKSTNSVCPLGKWGIAK